MIALAYVLGLATLPALVALTCLADVLRSGVWVTARTECRHDGPSLDEQAWRLFWRCPQPVDDDETPCGGRWVRRYVARVVPARLLRTKPIEERR